MIATGIQGIPAVLILIGLPFTPSKTPRLLDPCIVLILLFLDSPRWLLSKGRRSEAIECLHRIRPKRAVQDGTCELEIAAFESHGSLEAKAPWSALLNSANRRRTAIACAIMAFQQLTGVTFSSSYGPTFYQQQGLGSKSFLYAVSDHFN